MKKTGARGRVWLTEDRAPLYVVTFQGVPSNEDFTAYLDHMLVVSRRGRHAMVFDATDAGLIPATQRKMQSDWMAEHDELNREMTVAIAFVLPNPLLRGLVTAVLWVQPMPCAHRVFSSRHAAVSWCEGQLLRQGVSAAG